MHLTTFVTENSFGKYLRSQQLAIFGCNHKYWNERPKPNNGHCDQPKKIFSNDPNCDSKHCKSTNQRI